MADEPPAAPAAPPPLPRSPPTPASCPCVLVIVESTYGTSRHLPRPQRETLLLDTIRAALDRGGRVIMPVVALGRAQVGPASYRYHKLCLTHRSTFVGLIECCISYWLRFGRAIVPMVVLCRAQVESRVTDRCIAF